MRGGSTPHNGKRSSSDAPSSVRQEDGRLLAESRDSFPDSKGILRILVVRSPLIAKPPTLRSETFADKGGTGGITRSGSDDGSTRLRERARIDYRLCIVSVHGEATVSPSPWQ